MLQFLNKAGFPIRKPTHIGQALKDNSYVLFDRFIYNIITFRKEMEIFEDLNRIDNVDETPIWFDMTYNTTIAKLGEKSIKVRNFGGERLRVSLNSLNDNIHIKKNEIYIRYQENAWASEDLFLNGYPKFVFKVMLISSHLQIHCWLWIVQLLILVIGLMIYLLKIKVNMSLFRQKQQDTYSL